jgi:hypothetical protein
MERQAAATWLGLVHKGLSIPCGKTLKVGSKITRVFLIGVKETRCCGILSAKCPVFWKTFADSLCHVIFARSLSNSRIPLSSGKLVNSYL